MPIRVLLAEDNALLRQGLERLIAYDDELELVASVAELSAHLSLPLGVVRVLIGDLAEEGLVVVHTGSPSAAPAATNLKVLESVLNGISSL